MSRPPPDAIAFAEKLLLLLDQGVFTATYKFAVLLALLDLCLEETAADGRPPTEVSSRALARRIVELYWPHTRPFRGEVVLRQNSGRPAAILTLIRRFREEVGGRATTAARGRIRDPDGFGRLLDEVEWKLIQMPLPRLQVIGGVEERFIYDLDWEGEPRRSDIRSGRIDPTVRLRPGVGKKLVALGGLLRPLIQRQWAERVVRFNREHVKEFELEDFLFGAPRTPTGRLLSDLRELQDDRCFYCEDRLPRRIEVDHFIPWARHPDDGVHNLVVADARCNNAKRDFLAATDHVDRWSGRVGRWASQLEAIATRHRWSSDPERTGNVARAIYLRLREDARLWLEGSVFEPPDPPRLKALLVDEGRRSYWDQPRKVAEEDRGSR